MEMKVYSDVVERVCADIIRAHHDDRCEAAMLSSAVKFAHHGCDYHCCGCDAMRCDEMLSRTIVNSVTGGCSLEGTLVCEKRQHTC